MTDDLSSLMMGCICKKILLKSSVKTVAKCLQAGIVSLQLQRLKSGHSAIQDAFGGDNGIKHLI